MRLGKNVGFARANNFAVERTEGCEWIALVNPDAFPEPTWLETLVGAAAEHPEYTFFASRLVDAAHAHDPGRNRRLLPRQRLGLAARTRPDDRSGGRPGKTRRGVHCVRRRGALPPRRVSGSRRLRRVLLLLLRGHRPGVPAAARRPSVPLRPSGRGPPSRRGDGRARERLRRLPRTQEPRLDIREEHAERPAPGSTSRITCS